MLQTMPMNNFDTDNHMQSLQRLARQRAGAKLGWYSHAVIYVLVNLGLGALSWSQGRHWAVYPAIGWGLGLAAHGLLLWGLWLPGGGLYQRLIAHEEALLRRRSE